MPGQGRRKSVSCNTSQPAAKGSGAQRKFTHLSEEGAKEERTSKVGSMGKDWGEYGERLEKVWGRIGESMGKDRRRYGKEWE
jgi:hypothetical protein